MKKKSERLTHDFRAQRLFGYDTTLEQLLLWMERGAEIKVTRLSEAFTYQQYLEHYGEGTQRLFYVDERGRIRWAIAGEERQVKDSWTIAALVFSEESDGAKQQSLQELAQARSLKPATSKD